MKSYAIGAVVAGVAAWYGAREAHAQNIDVTVTGPLAIYTDTSTMEFTGTVTGYNDYLFRLWVYLNGTIKHDSMTLCYTGSDATYFVYNTNTWGLKVGDEVKFRVRVWISTSIWDQEYLTLHVEESQNQTYLQPSDAPDERPAGGTKTLYAAVIRSDEQELLA